MANQTSNSYRLQPCPIVERSFTSRAKPLAQDGILTRNGEFENVVSIRRIGWWESLSKAETKPEVLVCASAIGFYGETGDEEFTEDSPSGDDFLAEVCQDWEKEAQKAEAMGIRVVHLRLGHVLGKGRRITPNHASPRFT